VTQVGDSGTSQKKRHREILLRQNEARSRDFGRSRESQKTKPEDIAECRERGYPEGMAPRLRSEKIRIRDPCNKVLVQLRKLRSDGS